MFSNNSFCKLWAVEDKGKYSVVELSTSRKNKETDEYETDFSSKFVRFVGEAHNRVKKMEGTERIKLLNCGVTTSKYNDKWYTNFLVFDFEKADSPKSSSPDEGYDGEVNEDDMLPC